MGFPAYPQISRGPVRPSAMPGPSLVAANLWALKTNRRPEDVEWFVYIVVHEGGVEIQVPDGPLCFCCGHAVESYRPLTYEQVRKKFSSEAAFRKAFGVVKDTVERAKDALKRMSEEKSISQDKTVGLKVWIPVGLVPADIFAVAFKVPAKSVPIAKIVALPNPTGEDDIEGIVMRHKDIPAGLPHYTAELFVTKSLCMHNILLSSDTVVRQGQADDEFLARCQLANKAHSLNATQFLKIKGFKQYQQSAKTVEDDRKRQELLEKQQGGGGGADDEESATARGQVVTSSRWAEPSRPQVEAQGPRKRGQSTGPRQPAAGGGGGKRAKTAVGAGDPPPGGDSDSIVVTVNGGSREDSLDPLSIMTGARLGRELKGVLHSDQTLRPLPHPFPSNSSFKLHVPLSNGPPPLFAHPPPSALPFRFPPPPLPHHLAPFLLLPPPGPRPPSACLPAPSASPLRLACGWRSFRKAAWPTRRLRH